MTYKCYLLEPLLGESFDTANDSDIDAHWPPLNYIVGWRRKDTGEVRENKNKFGVGAMWYATWYPKNWTWKNESEPHLIVCCPNPDENDTRDWDIDSRSSDCGSPNDVTHRCWVRVGIPPDITVSKGQPGQCCSAGAGSILLPKWHGMLENGILRPC